MLALDSYQGPHQKSNYSFVFRFLFKPDSGTLWGYNQLYVSPSHLKQPHTKEELDKEEDENTEVDLAKTFWLVLRKHKSQNQVLRNFHNECTSYNIKVKDIVKFGRVNFRVTALSSKKLKSEIQGNAIL